MDTNNQNQSSNSEEDLSVPSFNSTQIVPQQSFEYYNCGAGLYHLYYTRYNDGFFAIMIEFLETIAVREGEEREIEINTESVPDIPEFARFALITLKYPGLIKGTEISQNTESSEYTISIPNNKEAVAELYYKLLPHGPDIEHDFIESYENIVDLSYFVCAFSTNYYIFPVFCPRLVPTLNTRAIA